MMDVMAAAALGTITGATAAAIAVGSIMSGKLEDQRARHRKADELRCEEQSIAVHPEDNAHAVR